MKDKQVPEEEIFEDLDKMYQRVADIEKEEAEEASMQKKEKPKPKKKRSSRPLIIVVLIACVILAGILAFPFLKQMTTPLLPKKSEPPPHFVVTPPVPKAKPPAPLPVPKEQEAMKTIPEEVEKPKAVPPAPPPVPKEQEAMKTIPKEVEKPKAVPPAPLPVPKEQEAMKTIPEEVEKPKPIPKEITKPSKPLPREKFYTIQIGAFHDLKYARDLLENLKKDGLDAYLTRLESKTRGILYKVFVGHFTDEKEAAQFLKEKKILNDHPGSFIRKGPSFKIHRLLGEKHPVRFRLACYFEGAGISDKV
jgi:cell division septation protein DedD